VHRVVVVNVAFEVAEGKVDMKPWAQGECHGEDVSRQSSRNIF
jgi:hypothetical protein